MTFSDADLKELKELTKASLYWSPKIPDLIARLEAAETLINELIFEDKGKYFPSYSEDADVSQYDEFKNWRKAAGKDGVK